LLLSTALGAVRAEPRLQERAPALTITAADGRDFDFDAMRGKVVLVAFWATWCAPCLEEMPTLETYYREHKGHGFEVIALSIDKPASREKALKVLAMLSFPGAMLSEASRNGFGKPEGVPVSYVVDAQGLVRDKFIAIDKGLLDEVITPLLKESSVAPIPAEMPR
jgi:thiol-disulfide isomerase/thioredoxin